MKIPPRKICKKTGRYIPYFIQDEIADWMVDCDIENLEEGIRTFEQDVRKLSPAEKFILGVGPNPLDIPKYGES